MDRDTGPRLVEPGIKYFLNASLEQCRFIKNKYYNAFYNLGLFLLFVFVIFITLYFKYKNKNNKELQKEMKKKQDEYILQKLQFMQDYNKSQSQKLINDEVNWKNHTEVQFYNRKIFS